MSNEKNARNLVGMTEGAKKRAALYQSLYSQDTSHIKMTNKQLRLVWRSVWPLSNWARGQREKLRLNYRIGQRLRPCPGCAKCLKCPCGNIAACIGLYEPWSKHQKPEPACDECCGHGCEDGHCDKLANAVECNGSGVIYARKMRSN